LAYLLRASIFLKKICIGIINLPKSDSVADCTFCLVNIASYLPE